MKRSDGFSRRCLMLLSILSGLLLTGYYPTSREQRPGFFTNISVMTPDLDIVTLDELVAGKKTFVFYFLPGCHHCEQAAPAVARLAQTYGQAIPFLGISPGREPMSELTAFKVRHGLPFPVVQDASGVFSSRNALRGTPTFLFTFGDNSPPETFNGFTPELEKVLEVALRRHLGQEALSVLDPDHYAGSQVCSVCHREQYLSWSAGFHSTAFQSLLSLGMHEDKKCVKCHTLGAGEKDGFVSYETTLFAASVGCEACHGKAGGHNRKPGSGDAPSGDKTTEKQDKEPSSRPPLEERFGAICERCHDPGHRGRWDIKEALAAISHKSFSTLSEQEMTTRRTNLVKGQIERVLLSPPAGGIAGSETCKPCHEAAYLGWSGSQHATAIKHLEEKDAASRVECLPCHATLKPGLSGEKAEDWQPGISCESCHGGGEAHVKAGGGKGNIASFKGAALECVMQNRCGTCHDAANDPDFQLEAALTRLRKLHRTK